MMEFLQEYKTYLMIGAAPFLISTTWILYLAIMNLMDNRSEMKPLAWVLATPIIFIGLVFDVLLNLVLGTIIFLELPQLHKKEWLFTPRVARHKYTSESGSYRERVAFYICSHLLDPFDPRGRHCNPPN